MTVLRSRMKREQENVVEAFGARTIEHDCNVTQGGRVVKSEGGRIQYPSGTPGHIEGEACIIMVNEQLGPK